MAGRRGGGSMATCVVGSRPVVVGASPAAPRLARLIGGRVVRNPPDGANVLRIVPGRGLRARRSGDRVTFELGALDASRLARDPRLARYRFEGLP